MLTTFTLPKWYDLHAHFRQDGLLPPLIEQHLKMGCVGILAMPNTKPPVSRVFESGAGEGWSVEGYLAMLTKAGGDKFDDIIVPLYLTAATTPQMIEKGVKAGVLRAAKYYPPHGTTNSEHGADLKSFIENGVIAALQDNNVVFCIHGEEHGLSGEAYFGRATNAEESFYRKSAPLLLEKFPRLKFVAEHITTKVAADFVNKAGANVAATVTPQHLLYTVGHLLQGCKYHLYCMPLVKFDEDRDALRRAVTAKDNRKFFAGTDSAPHTIKATPCGCAAGCYTGGIAPQLYAQAFEEAGSDLATPAVQEAFKKFLCTNGAEFYGLKISSQTFTLSKQPEEITLIKTAEGTITPLPIGLLSAPAEKTTLSWRVN